MGLEMLTNKQVPNWIVGILVIAIVILFGMTIGFGVKASGFTAFTSHSSQMPGGQISFAAAKSGQSQGYNSFLNRPEPPVFYQIGDTELVRSDRAKEQVDKFSGSGREYMSALKSGFENIKLNPY